MYSQPQKKQNVINDAGSKARKGEGNARSSVNDNENKNSTYTAGRKQTNTAPTQSASSGVKVGGHFQSNAMMIMAPYPAQSQGMMYGAMGQMPMYQPVPVQMSNGYQMMPPGFYPMPAMGYQSGGNLLAANQYGMAPAGFNYPVGGTQASGTKSASHYFPGHDDDRGEYDQRIHGKTDQGDFKVNCG